MKNTLANVWHLIGGVVISDLGEKIFLFKLFHDVDIDKVIKGAPWTFNNHLLVFHRLLEDEDPMEVDREGIPELYENTRLVDVRVPLKRRKKLVTPSGKQFYARFQYEKGHTPVSQAVWAFEIRHTAQSHTRVPSFVKNPEHSVLNFKD
ncbi:hypothetical protein Golob_027786, partial [Gossypium lobatum]|nr:hypothetical protein [Gossypium lobatum]